MQVSTRRDRVGRIIFALLGATAVVAGAMGVLGLRSVGSRVWTVIVGLSAIVSGASGILLARRAGEAKPTHHDAPT